MRVAKGTQLQLSELSRTFNVHYPATQRLTCTTPQHTALAAVSPETQELPPSKSESLGIPEGEDYRRRVAAPRGAVGPG
jgi:hypothetical protein